MVKDFAYYMGLNYPIVLTRDEDSTGWYAEIPLIGALGDGATPDEAVADVRDALQGWISIMLEDGDVIPEPELTHVE